jgi:hypothetical protein
MLKYLISIILIFQNFFIAAQKADSVFLTRFLEDEPIDSIDIPLSACYIASNASFKETEFGWHRQDELQNFSYSTFIIEMNSTSVTIGPWSEYTPGSFQLIIRLKNESKSDYEIILDTLNENSFHLINNYAGFENPDILSGKIRIVKENGNYFVDGLISVKSKKPYTKQNIVFRQRNIPALQLAQIKAVITKREKDAKEKQSAISKLYDTLSFISKNFYDQIRKPYPSVNFMTARSVLSGNKAFKFNLENSYGLSKAQIKGLRNNLSESLSGTPAEIADGDFCIIQLQFLYDPIKRVIDDEINFNIPVQVDSLITNQKIRAKKGFYTSLVFRHWGPGGHNEMVRDYDGYILIKKYQSNLLRGYMNIKFTENGKVIFSIKGSFILNVISKKMYDDYKLSIDEIDRKISELYSQIEY